MSTQAVPTDQALTWRARLTLARLLRSRLATSGRHRFALAVAFVVLAFLLFDAFSSDASPSSLASKLQIIGWCSAWSVSGTLLGFDAPNLGQLLRLRGKSYTLARDLLPLSRVALALTVHGSACALLGFILLATSTNASALAAAALAALMLLLIAALFALGLAALATLAALITERHAGKLFWAALLVPAVLHRALFELPSLMHWLSAYTERALYLGGL